MNRAAAAPPRNAGTDRTPEHPPFQDLGFWAYLPPRGPLPTRGKIADNLDHVQ